MRILITGGAGCLGSNLIEYYLPQGNEIFVIDNYATGKREVLPEIKGLTVVEGSVADKALIDQCFETFKPTHVIHSAAAYKDPENWEEDVMTNVVGSIHVAKAALRIGVKRVINFQTALCYGRPVTLPIPATAPAKPFTSYGISKTAGEAFLLNSGLSVVSLRLANICGPRLAIGPIPTFYKRLKNSQPCFCSDSVRDFLDMSDFLSLMNILLASDKVSGVFNVSTGEGHSIKEVFEVVAEYLNITVPDVPVTAVGADDVQAVVLDSSSTEKVFGWQAKISFRDTIRRQLEWYDAYGISDVFSHLQKQS